MPPPALDLTTLFEVIWSIFLTPSPCVHSPASTGRLHMLLLP